MLYVVVNRIGCFPAFVVPKGTFALVFATGGSNASSSHIQKNILYAHIEIIQAINHFHHVQLALVIEHLLLYEQAIHVAFQCWILEYLAIEELGNRFCYTKYNRMNVKMRGSSDSWPFNIYYQQLHQFVACKSDEFAYSRHRFSVAAIPIQQ